MTRILQPYQASWIDYPDNESISVVACLMGCDNGCYHCQNPDFQNPNYSELTKEMTPVELYTELKEFANRNRTNKLVLSGGDPLAPCNIDFTRKFLEISDFDTCIYTGHSIEYVKSNNIKGFTFVKCGKFEFAHMRESFKDDDKMVFASPNQELYDQYFNLLSNDGIYNFNN